MCLSCPLPSVTDDYEDIEFDPILNELAWDLVQQAIAAADDLRIEVVDSPAGGIIDFGVETVGSLGAGLALAEICTAGLMEMQLAPGDLDGIAWPQVFVSTDSPLEACLLSQYAGWQLSVGKFFGMGSGPMRAAAFKEELFDDVGYKEKGERVVGVIESSKLPGPDVISHIAEACGVEPKHVALCVAPTASVAGNLQIAARSVETAMHKLFELGFDVSRVESGLGWAPLPPVAADDLTGIGRTNDAILYGGRITLFVTGDDESLEEIGPQLPSSGSEAFGQPFIEIFKAAGHDFYQIDPHLFSPAEVVFHNTETGRVHRYGQVRGDIVRKSFGV
ncbi:MAG: methenyltetrahydromethanopterin cyclohydrolase [Planctomycetaceae bacterium]|nr:methenyltetrahydromethanopterin cyclohydrolase [Planctomycetaceae bacterium]